MSRMTAELFDITELAHHGPEDVFISGVTVVGAIAIMFTIQWRLALVLLILIPLFMVVVFLNRRSMAETSKRVKQTTAGINADIESTISGMRTAKAFSNEGAESEKFQGANERFKTSKRDYYRAMARFNSSMEFFLCIMPVTVIAVGGLLIMDGQMTYVDLITFSLYTSTFINPIRKLSNLSEMLVNGFAGLRRFVELMRIEPDLKDKPDALELANVRGQIDVSDVSFAYERDDTEVLHHVSLHVKPGETIAIITIDGHDVRDVTQKSLRRNIGVVQQDVFLFAASIMENIRYGRPGATTDEVIEAARRAEIYDDIMAMPQGFDTYVGERGALLSGGQKQRISIARIFLKNPPILILDEATSALDSVTEAKIQRAFDELAKGRTTLIIAQPAASWSSGTGSSPRRAPTRSCWPRAGTTPSSTTPRISMDKAAVIARVASDPADRLLLARVLDQYEKAERRGIPAATVFLSPREQAMAQALLNTLGVRSGYVFDGGYEGAERKLLAFLPDWAEDAAGELAFFRAAFRDKDAVLTHRDILGSLMGLGITRERVGDILVSPHSADVVASPSLGEFFLREWDSAGRTRLTVTEIGREELLVPEVKVTRVQDTVSSMRLDAVVSAAFSMSRGRAGELIAAGRVSLDHNPCLKPDKPVGEGAVVTARGFGRAVVRECGRTSKKGRIILVMDRYG